MSPTPSPIDVLIHPGPAQWWEVLGALGPLAVLLGALLAAFISWGTLRQRTAADALALAQKREADNRAEWWKRTQWALDHVLDEDPDSQALGLAALAVLARSELARPEELELLDIAWQAVGATPEDDEGPAAGNVDSVQDMGDNETDSRQRGGPEMSASTPERRKTNPPRPASGTAKPAAASEHRVQVAAAKLRVALDERLGRPTPPKTKALARENF